MKNVFKIVGIILMVGIIGFGFVSCDSEKDCEGCGGSGKVTCEPCDGKGHYAQFVVSSNSIEDAPCPTCGGSGERKCNRCNGTGKW